MTPSKLKAAVQAANVERHFFEYKTMRFFGDTMKNYGVRRASILSHYDRSGTYYERGTIREVWELYRRRPVKHGLQSSAYFDVETFARVFEVRA